MHSQQYILLSSIKNYKCQFEFSSAIFFTHIQSINYYYHFVRRPKKQSKICHSNSSNRQCLINNSYGMFSIGNYGFKLLFLFFLNYVVCVIIWRPAAISRCNDSLQYNGCNNDGVWTKKWENFTILFCICICTECTATAMSVIHFHQ